MLDVRMDLMHTLDSDSKTFTTCRKLIHVSLFEGEFGKALGTTEVINPRSYPQAAAALRRIGHFINDLSGLASKETELGERARRVRNLEVGALVITIYEYVGPKADEPVKAIAYDIPIRCGYITDYTRKYTTYLPGDSAED